MKAQFRIDQVMKVYEQRALDALTLIGTSGVKWASEKCPVDTSNLINSLTYATEKEQPSPKATLKGASAIDKPMGLKVRIGTNVEYAKFVEFGTSKMKAQPYLRPAIFNRQEQIRKFLDKAINGK